MKYTGILKGVLKSVELRDLSSSPTLLNIIPTVYDCEQSETDKHSICFCRNFRNFQDIFMKILGQNHRKRYFELTIVNNLTTYNHGSLLSSEIAVRVWRAC